jgi:oligoendopeptidase F
MAATPTAREQALEALLSSMAIEIFTSAEETSFERRLYTSASGSALLDRDRIDTIYRASIAPYEYWPMSDVGTSRAWMNKDLLFEDPLYLVNYLYASFVAVALYDQIQVDPDFSRKYEALLRRGFDADPKDLLASVGIHLDDPGLIRSAIALFRAKTEELRALYDADASGPPPRERAP